MRLLLTLLLVCLFAPLSVQAQSVTIEGFGLINSDLQGALPKGLWRKQPRSEITALLKTLPAGSPLRSIQQIKRNMLVSNYDTSVILNDIPAKPGDDLLTLRLHKLMEMGLWEDALNIYTQSVKDPNKNNELAEVGVMLLLNEKGLSTACLEANVFAQRFQGDVFWTRIDNICDIELGNLKPSTADFAGSDVLDNIYNDKNYKILANDIEQLRRITPLELAILAKKNRIKYQALNFALKTPPHIVKTFLQDPDFPAAFKTQLENQARKLALLPESPLSEVQKHRLNSIQNLSQAEFIPLLSAKLKAGDEITEKELKKLAKLAEKNPENYYYIQLIDIMNSGGSKSPLPKDKINLGIQAINEKNQKKVNLLKTTLDKPAEFSNNPSNVYEKQISLTPDGHYVMPKGGLMKWLGILQQHRFNGLSLLVILSNVENNAATFKTEDNSEDTTFNVLKSLSTVGLIDQSHQVAREELANLMGNT